MAVALRLSRQGNTHRPHYYIVAADSRMPRNGRFLEKIGTYNPLGDKQLTVDSEKAQKWINNGAQVSSRVKGLLKVAGVIS